MTPRRRQPEARPDPMRVAIKNAYNERQAEWHTMLMELPIDWTELLGLHLQLRELEALMNGLETPRPKRPQNTASGTRDFTELDQASSAI